MHQAIRIDTDKNTLYVSAFTSLSESTKVSVGTAASNFAHSWHVSLRNPITFRYISNKVQLYTIYLFIETALHVSGGTPAHHQEHIQLYLRHLALVKL